jgi:hypothetical protein
MRVPPPEKLGRIVLVLVVVAAVVQIVTLVVR